MKVLSLKTTSHMILLHTQNIAPVILVLSLPTCHL